MLFLKKSFRQLVTIFIFTSNYYQWAITFFLSSPLSMGRPTICIHFLHFLFPTPFAKLSHPSPTPALQCYHTLSTFHPWPSVLLITFIKHFREGSKSSLRRQIKLKGLNLFTFLRYSSLIKFLCERSLLPPDSPGEGGRGGGRERWWSYKNMSERGGWETSIAES